MTSYPLSWPTYTGVKSDTLTLTRIQRAHKSPFSGATQVVANFSRWDLAIELPAMRLANAAAGIVVAKLGTAVCHQQELFAL